MNQRLEEAKQAVKEHKALLAQRDRAEQRSKAKQQQHERLATRLAELRQEAGVASDDDFERLAVAAARRKTLADEVAGLRREIVRIAGNEEPEGFRAELARADADALVLASRQAKEDLDAAEEGYRKAVEEEALAKKQVEDLDGQDRASELVQKLESDRAELRDSVERWAPLVLADAILAQAIARFEREHQPAMLRDVGAIVFQADARSLRRPAPAARRTRNALGCRGDREGQGTRPVERRHSRTTVPCHSFGLRSTLLPGERAVAACHG